MSIYLEKKGGKFRVEVQGKLGRYRDRCDTRKDAKAREDAFKRMRTNQVPPPNSDREQRPVTTSAKFSEVLKEAKGRIWRGMPSEHGNLAALQVAQDVMGDCDIESIDDAWVLKLRHSLLEKRGLTDATANRYLSALSRFLKWSKAMKYRKAGAPEIPWTRETSHRIRWITHIEEQQIYALVPDNVAKVVRIGIRYGMRRGEILSLEPKQIQDGWVHIWKTKSNSPRSLPLKPEDVEDLRWLVAGNMPTIEDLRKAWDKLRVDMKLTSDKEFVFHATRHTCATRMVQRNVNLRLIQKWMGHKTIQMTLRYAQVNDEMLSGVLEQMVA